jgi:Tol biopolymer transport system component
MALNPGTRLGGYEVIGLLGAGGMGEVYRARDAKLARDVAIKILPQPHATDAERLMRFEREARTLASLTHPNIAQIYGCEQVGDTTALVLELVDGPTLADRIQAGPLAINEAIAIAKQICSALVASHDHGIVHRDLKPANIKLTSDGTVKVLDFGLAKLSGDEEVQPASATKTSPATIRGTILGTAAYMSPEQARGLRVDRRTDLWAFGCVMYEMLTAKPAFDGGTTTDVLAAVIGREPDWEALPVATVPHSVRILLKKCLRKDRAHRWRDAGDAALALEPEAQAEMPRPTARTMPWLVFVSAAVVVAMMGFAVAWTRRAAPIEARPTARLVLPIPDANRLGDSRIALSRDGSRLAYTAVGRSNRALYLYDLAADAPRAVAGVTDPFEPFFSNDGMWLGVQASGKLLRINVLTGGVEESCVIEGQFDGGAFTGDNSTIVFAQRGRIQIVAAAGGTPKTLIETSGRQLRYPSFFGESKILFTSVTSSGPSEIVVRDLDTGAERVVAQGDDARYASSGHLLFARGQTLFAVPFDANTLDALGPVVRVVEGVQQTTRGGGVFDVNDSAMLVYARGIGGAQRRLVRVDRQGKASAFDMAPRNLQSPHVSPDGSKIVFEDLDLPHSAWVFDTTTGALSKLAPPDNRHNPVWSWDGSRIVFQANRDGSGRGDIYWMPVDGSAAEERLITSKQGNLNALSWLPGGRGLALVEFTNTDRNILLNMLQPRGELEPLLNTPALEAMAQFSSDGRWLAYVSNVSKSDQVYVRAFPDTGGLWQVSSDGGTQPVWARDRKEIFFRNGTSMFVADVRTDGVFSSGRPRELFRNPNFTSRVNIVDYDVFPDGQHFVMVEEVTQSGSAQLQVITDWSRLLSRGGQ